MADVQNVPVWGWALIGVGAAVVALLLLDKLTAPAYFNLRDKVVVITGGSSGIGKAVAAAALKRGAHVALVARKAELLSAAAAELQAAKVRPDQRITTHSADVAVHAAAVTALDAAAAAHGGRIDALVCSAGISCPREFEATSTAEFTQVWSVNVLGCRNAALAALPHMRSKEGGRMVFVSSQAGQVGLFGYTAYSSSKFALAGLAQSLAQELHTRRILVSLSFPPDTDTPLLASENETKPEVTKRLSEATATVSAEEVAGGIVSGLARWRPYISVGFDGWMLATLTSGMGPAGSLLQATLQIFTMGLWRLVALIYLGSFYSTVAKYDTKHVDWVTGAVAASGSSGSVGGTAAAAAAAAAVTASAGKADKVRDGPASERKNK